MLKPCLCALIFLLKKCGFEFDKEVTLKSDKVFENFAQIVCMLRKLDPDNAETYNLRLSQGKITEDDRNRILFFMKSIGVWKKNNLFRLFCYYYWSVLILLSKWNWFKFFFFLIDYEFLQDSHERIDCLKSTKSGMTTVKILKTSNNG